MSVVFGKPIQPAFAVLAPKPWRLRSAATRACAACCAFFALTAWAQEATSPTTPLLPPRALYRLEVQGPDALKELVEKHAELQRFAALPDLTAPELERLLALAPDNIRQLLATQGHFQPQVVIDLQTNPGTDPAEKTVQVTLQPGPRTTVRKVSLEWLGPIADDPWAVARLSQWRAQWGLPSGQPFTQSAWDEAKSQLLRGVNSQRYPLATFSESQALIDSEQHQADLRVVVASGPVYTLGHLDIQGQERYSGDMAARLVRLAGLEVGQPYDEAVLQAAQKRLSDSGYYESAFVLLDLTTPPGAATVQIRLREVKRQRVLIGLGASTDSGPRVSFEHTDHRVPGLGWRAGTRLQLERDNQTLGTDLTTPVDSHGWKWVTGALFKRQLDEPVITTSQQFRLGQAQDGTELNRSLFVQYDRAKVSDTTGALTDDLQSSFSANYAWTRKRFDNLVFPTSGYGLGVELGAGVTLSQNRLPYLRGRVRWSRQWPLAENSSRPSRLALRLEGGGVWSRNDAPIPATQRFLAGGDNSVRGYPLRSIGVPNASGGVEAGRWLGVASVEWQRPLWYDGTRSPWEATAFVDSGAVSDDLGHLTPKTGVGMGVRYNSPVGPLQGDLAYGLERRRFRFHLSVGFVF